MVSLNRGDSSSTGGGVFFSESSLHSNDSDTHQLLQPVVGQEKVKKFTPLDTIPAAILILILGAILESITIGFTVYYKNDQIRCDSYMYTLYSQAVYWAVIFVLDFYFKRKHHESRIRGYLECYQKTHQYSRMPFFISSTCNAVLLVIETLFHEQYGDLRSNCPGDRILTPSIYTCCIVSLENMFMFSVVVSYICKVRRFNKHQLCPDVQRDDWMTSFIRESYSAGEVGYREKDNHVEDLLEKQADLLRHLKEQNSLLLKKVLVLSMQVNERRSSQFT